MERAKATYLAWAGAKRPPSVSRWPAGRYEGSVAVIDAGGVLKAERKATLDLN